MINLRNVLSRIGQRPQAMATVKGNENFPDINGNVYFYQTRDGVIIVSQIFGLPKSDDNCSKPIFGFHIHAGGVCSGNETDRFANTMGHYNPYNCNHPYHAGDLAPLFGCNGDALSAFLTDRFTAREIIGKTIIIHSAPDDFTTQPSGNSGDKIACGEIRAAR